MNGKLGTVPAIVVLLITMAGEPAFAEKQGGVLKRSHFDSPASMSILEFTAR
jgi:hypothetical protein